MVSPNTDRKRPDMGSDFITDLRAARLLAIIRGANAAASVTSAMTLLEEGFRYLEISLNTQDAIEVIRAVARDAPAGTLIGAGTVLTVDDVHRVRDAGGHFAVTPAVAASVAECARLGFPVVAGALTPTECVSAMEQGAAAVKLFPASLGGPEYLRALRDPLPRVPFVAVGGVGVDQVEPYFTAGAVAVGLGSPLLGDAPAGGSQASLRERARAFQSAVAAWQSA